MSPFNGTVEGVVLMVFVEMVDVSSACVAGDKHLDNVIVAIDGSNLNCRPSVFGHKVPGNSLNIYYLKYLVILSVR